MPYDPELVAPMRKEMTDMGAQELMDPAQVEEWFAQTGGTGLLFINSVCGCAAGSARPGLRIALGGENTPDRVATVFAGQDVGAVASARACFEQFPPSSPSAVLVKDGEPVFFMPRHAIEGRDAPSVAFEFVNAFDEFCKA